MKNNWLLRSNANNSVFYLNGGIGNQLFGYAAGKAFSKINNKNVVFDISNIERGFTNHGSSILSLKLNLQLAPSRSPLHQFFSKIENKIHRIFSKLSRKHGAHCTQYHSDEIGYDSKLFYQQYASDFRGYFQSWKYFDLITENFPASDSILISPSDWLLDICKIAKKSEPIFMHVRRGDYLILSELYGLLDSEYYAKAIQRARDFFPNNPIWVISDDIDQARNLLESVVPTDTTWIKPPEGTDPVESLVLMSQGVANIIANSTFSWWGAMLNKESIVTLAPDKWFKGMKDPADLYPSNWLLVKSSWQT